MKKKMQFWSFCLVCSALFFASSLFAQTSGENDDNDNDNPVEIEIKTPKDTIQARVIVKRSDDEDEVEMEEDDDDDDDDDDGWNVDWMGDDDDDDDFDSNEIKTSNGSRVRFTMLDIGLSGYLFDGGFGLPSDLDNLELLYGGSLNINLHIFRQRLAIIPNTVFFEYGVGVSWMQYKFADDFRILEDTDMFQTEPIDNDLRKNKLKTTFIEVPVMLTITPGKNDNYFISGGVYGGVMVGSKQKIKTSNGDVSKFRDDFNLNKFRYGIEGRVGLGPISFYAQYSLVDLFQDNQGPELTPINLGITVLGF